MNRKTWIILAVLLVLGVIIVFMLNQQEPGSGQSGKADQKFITYRDPKLTDVEKRELNKNIDQLRERLNAADNDQDRYKLNIQIGLQYYLLGELETAKKSYEQATTIIKDNPTSWAELYVVNSAMGDYQSAVKSLDKAIEFNPSSSQYWRWKIEIMEGPLAATQEDLERVYKEAVEKTGSATDVLILYARFLKRNGNQAEAVRVVQEAIKLRPEFKQLYEEELRALETPQN